MRTINLVLILISVSIGAQGAQTSIADLGIDAADQRINELLARVPSIYTKRDTLGAFHEPEGKCGIVFSAFADGGTLIVEAKDGRSTQFPMVYGIFAKCFDTITFHHESRKIAHIDPRMVGHMGYSAIHGRIGIFNVEYEQLFYSDSLNDREKNLFAEGQSIAESLHRTVLLRRQTELKRAIVLKIHEYGQGNVSVRLSPTKPSN